MTLKVKVKNFIIFIVLFTYLKPFNVSLIPTLNTLYSIAKMKNETEEEYKSRIKCNLEQLAKLGLKDKELE